MVVIEKPPELYHFGVKGMRWGVRRAQPLADAKVIKKGTTFNRISTQEEKKANPGRTYVTYTDADHDYYKENMTKYRKQTHGANVKLYDVSYTNMRDIVYPSHEKQVSEFVDMYNNKTTRKLLASQISHENTSRYLESTYGVKFSRKDIEKTDVYKTLKKEFEEYDNRTAATEGYNQFIKTYSDISVSKIYNKRLIKQGYNAIMDDNDIMNNTMDSIRPKNSLILFSGRKELTRASSKELTDQEYKRASSANQRRRAGI